MKKAVLFYALFIIAKLSFGQTESLPHSYLTGFFSDTITVSVSKDVLYNRAKEYLAKDTPLKKGIIEMDDRELGRLIANTTSVEKEDAAGLHLIISTYVIKFTTSIAVKDNKFKYIINNVTYDEDNVTPLRATDMIKKVVAELIKSMTTKSNLEF